MGLPSHTLAAISLQPDNEPVIHTNQCVSFEAATKTRFCPAQMQNLPQSCKCIFVKSD